MRIFPVLRFPPLKADIDTACLPETFVRLNDIFGSVVEMFIHRALLRGFC